MIEALQIVTTTATKGDAEKIARGLVERRLVACVQIAGPITSCYRWEGKIETAEEWICTIKTRRDLYPQVETAIKALHSYQAPEILATQVVEGSTEYLQWLSDETA